MAGDGGKPGAAASAPAASSNTPKDRVIVIDVPRSLPLEAATTQVHWHTQVLLLLFLLLLLRWELAMFCRGFNGVSKAIEEGVALAVVCLRPSRD